ncbi:MULTISPECIES: hypothetical protein [Roseomonadaceae]|uniref:Uncharacterized protein n=1 Tax=Falsiroseomonas oleicola TaxID=2801474 RepID=A0ABS6HEI1_9PROT|nr:hypothetical protein [Roseomonas oleicola]MBU8546083.1 hypothetical protein [Roseomonas oleicola]
MIRVLKPVQGRLQTDEALTSSSRPAVSPNPEAVAKGRALRLWAAEQESRAHTILSRMTDKALRESVEQILKRG